MFRTYTESRDLKLISLPITFYYIANAIYVSLMIFLKGFRLLFVWILWTDRPWAIFSTNCCVLFRNFLL